MKLKFKLNHTYKINFVELSPGEQSYYFVSNHRTHSPDDTEKNKSNGPTDDIVFNDLPSSFISELHILDGFKQ